VSIKAIAGDYNLSDLSATNYAPSAADHSYPGIDGALDDFARGSVTG
jgi:hypothetical protein